jgi:hypothetical protein
MRRRAVAAEQVHFELFEAENGDPRTLRAPMF